MSFLEDWREKVIYTIIPNEAVTDANLQECAELFSNHYGKWSNKKEYKDLVPSPGKHVKMKSSKLKSDYLFNNRCGLVTAKVDQYLIGHAFFTIFYILPDSQFEIRWVTQLVVHTDCRHHKVAQNLLLHSLGTQAQGYGLVTSHPHAVRALERAVRQKCFNIHPERVKEILQKSEIPYLHPSKVDISCSETQCLINTKFFVDHVDIQKALEKEIKNNEEIVQLEYNAILRQNGLQREQWLTKELESFKDFQGKDVTRKRSKLRSELDNVQSLLNEIGRSESAQENRKQSQKWIIGDSLPDGHEFLAIIFTPPTIQLPPFIPAGAEWGVNIFWKFSDPNPQKSPHPATTNE
jgi:hypothetical protein